MIPLEKQVTSLELSKQLKGLGIKQEGIFAWHQNLDGSIFCEYCQYQLSQDNQSTFHDGYAKLPIEICIAPTVAEHGEALPDGFHSIKFNQKYRIEYNNDFIEVPRQVDDNEADARAKMRIYLIEKKLI